MSNCHLVAGRSLIDLVASRLALRAPAQRAATALTRPNRSAPCLPCGRHNVPTAVTVGPNDIVADHRVEHDDHLAHHRYDHDLRQFAGGRETIAERLEHGIPITGAHCRHVEHLANVGTTAPDAVSAKREHLRIPSLLMRARAQATVRVWKKRPELQAHSRIGIRSGCGLPVATGAEP